MSVPVISILSTATGSAPTSWESSLQILREQLAQNDTAKAEAFQIFYTEV